MRQIKILKINPTTTTQGSIEIQGNFTSMFAGRFYRNAAGATLPGYTTPAPTGYTLIAATKFDIIGNTKYAGRYTVYTPQDSSDSTSATYDSVNNKTIVRVVEVVRPLVSGDPISVVSDGHVTNISTYLVETGGAAIVVPPGVTLTQYPVEIMGRDVSGWGEGYLQNFVKIARHFAGSNPPANPFVGMLHYDTDDQTMRVWSGSSWNVLNQVAFGSTFRFTQSTPSATWTINHGLNLPAPHIALVQFFVDRGDGPKIIHPADVTFENENQIIVSFSNPEIGYAIVKS